MKIRQLLRYFAILWAMCTLSVATFALETPSPLNPTASPMPISAQITLDDAVKIGIQRSVILLQLDNQVKLAALYDEKGTNNKKQINDAPRSISKGQNLINSTALSLEAAQQLVNQVKALLTYRQSPTAVSLAIPGVGSITIPANTLIDSILSTEQLAAIQKAVTDTQVQIDAGNLAVEAGRQSIRSAQNALDQSTIKIAKVIVDKLGIENANAWGDTSTVNLMTTMTGVSYDVTKYAYGIYRNQIALLIRKNFYDALKAQKVVALKQTVMVRALQQYQFAILSYESGMKAKDDMLLASVYMKGTQIELQKAMGDAHNARIELKKSMNIPMDA
ncbi:MAG: TolC family protein, partial [Hyphomonadaceae bacterium]|nr:TolC family protein [Clostridia bacterium]